MTEKKIVAVASDDNNGLNGMISAHFGRCPFYTFITLENDEVVETKALDNPYCQAHQPGVVPEFINSEKANVIISGGMGPRAITMFQQFNIEVITGASGKISDARRTYRCPSIFYGLRTATRSSIR